MLCNAPVAEKGRDRAENTSAVSSLADMEQYDRQRLFRRMVRSCEFNAQQLARHCGIGLRQLERHFKEAFGRPPKDWLNEQRMIAATILLKETRNVGLVARHLGYSRQSNFSREFKRRHGVTPSQYLAIFQRLNQMSHFE